MVALFAKSIDPNQTPHNRCRRILGLHCLPITRLGLFRLHWVLSPRPLPPPPPHRWFTLLTVLKRWPGVSLTLCCFVVYSTRRFVVCLSVCHFVLLVLRLPRLGKRELILVLFVCLTDLCLFGFVGFLFLLGSGKGCGL